MFERWRKFLEEHQTYVMAACAIVITAGVVVIIFELFGGRGHHAILMRTFYSTDDGATVFVDDMKTPPFDHEGAQAVQAYVFTCDGGAHHWVQYLLKYSDDALSKLALHQSLEGPSYGVLVKKPGDAKWIPDGTPAAKKIEEPKCPDGMGSGDPGALSPMNFSGK